MNNLLMVNPEMVGKTVFFTYHGSIYQGTIEPYLIYIPRLQDSSAEVLSIRIKSSPHSTHYIELNNIFETGKEAQAFLDKKETLHYGK